MPDLTPIYQHIHDQQPAHLARLQEYLRQPSISATGEGVHECAHLLADYYRALGCQEVEIVETAGHPGVWAYYDAGAERTFAVYGMYDVQPVADQPWSYDPFGAVLTPQEPFPQVVIARGAYNSKGPYLLFLNALASIIATTGSLPVNLMFLSEGEEEIGSPHYPLLVEKYAHRLQTAEALIDIEANQNKTGKIIAKLGNKGIVYVELVASGRLAGRGPATAPIHSSSKAVVDSPVWRLVHALSSLTSPDGNQITIDGFYDDVARPSAEDAQLMDALVKQFDDQVYAQLWDVPQWVNGVQGREWIEQYLFAPSLNIDGLTAGYDGTGTLTIVPHEARAKLDFRLVPNMNPQRILQLLRQHLDQHGFTDILIREQVAYNWNKTAVTHPAVQAMFQTYDKHTTPYEVWPHSAGSEPLYLFTQPPLSLPMLRFGLGHGSRNHAPDEYLVIEGNGRVAGLLEMEKAFVDFLYTLGEIG